MKEEGAEGIDREDENGDDENVGHGGGDDRGREGAGEVLVDARHEGGEMGVLGSG